MSEVRISVELVRRMLTGFIRNEVTKTGHERVVVGLSGGIDSSLSAYLGAEALGPAQVLGLIMPYRTSSSQSLEDARRVVAVLGIRSRVIDITPMIDAYFAAFPEADPVRRGNKMARERMTILYDFSMVEKALVLGTSNKTELLLGYGTLHGDMASAINPLGDLYKTQVRQLAEAMGIPETILRKPPTADLWQGQSDEGELGFTYAEVDRLLYYMVDRRYNEEQLQDLGFEPDFVTRVTKLVQGSQYKRRLPVIAKISNRTIDRDFRYARDWGR
ncbi:MAG: NAD+ synthase [Candidatus Tectomicrobia bacterium]|uniref:NH(3)-dependent NAD(+) synthetase n=1 Tax=Tectimicrobiota bacterium TaxID=2528274 RepID=A0A932GP12_UNCTE|nr:NAD+ synthase [Candidatus Tectomicrobia bacterium]